MNDQETPRRARTDQGDDPSVDELADWWALSIIGGAVSFAAIAAASTVFFWVQSPSFHPAPSDPQPPFQTPQETLWLFAAAAAIGLFILACGYYRQAEAEWTEDSPTPRARLLNTAAKLIYTAAGVVAVAAIALCAWLG
jgi:multisubunit Na+/H+ antiporter MnhB subunit